MGHVAGPIALSAFAVLTLASWITWPRVGPAEARIVAAAINGEPT